MQNFISLSNCQMPIRHSQLNLRRDISNGIPITPNITKVKKYYKYSVIVAQCKVK